MQQQPSDVEEREKSLLHQSAIESDRKFWAGERPISIVQWIGLLLMFVGVSVSVAGWVRDKYGTFIAVLGALVLFVVLGNRRARRRKAR